MYYLADETVVVELSESSVLPQVTQAIRIGCSVSYSDTEVASLHSAMSVSSVEIRHMPLSVKFDPSAEGDSQHKCSSWRSTARHKLLLNLLIAGRKPNLIF